jgi:beta-galactosidase/beta-glucuronidase
MNDHRIPLDGTWDFQIDRGDGSDVSRIREWRSAVVPMPWQAQFNDLRHAGGIAWYRRHFTVDPGSLRSAPAGAAILHFGVTDYHAGRKGGKECNGKLSGTG